MNAKGLFGYENVVGEYIEVTVGDKTARLRIIGVMDVSAMMGGMDNEAMMEQMLSLIHIFWKSSACEPTRIIS